MEKNRSKRIAKIGINDKKLCNCPNGANNKIRMRVSRNHVTLKNFWKLAVYEISSLVTSIFVNK